MKTIEYTIFIPLKVAGCGPCLYEIATSCAVELSDELYESLTKFVAEYSGDKRKIAQAIEKWNHTLHKKLLKEAMDDARYMLTINAIQSGFTEFTEEDLFEKDRFDDDVDFDEDEDVDENDNFDDAAYEEAFEEWRKQEQEKIDGMTRGEKTSYLAERYAIELDFDENDFSYRFTNPEEEESDNQKDKVFTEWID